MPRSRSTREAAAPATGLPAEARRTPASPPSKESAGPATGLLAFAVVVIWGLTFVSFTVALRYFTPAQVMFLRCTIAYVSLLIIYPHFHRSEGWKVELQLFFAGLCGTTLYVILSNEALLLTATSNVSVLSSLSPIFTALLVPLFFRGQAISPRVIVGFLVATAGAAAVSTGGRLEFDTQVTGSLLALASAVAWACYTNLLRHLKKSSYSQNYVTRRVFLYGIVTVAPILLLEGKPLDVTAFFVPEAVLNLLFLGLVAYTFCHVGWGLVTRRKGAVWASQWQYLTPIATMIGSAVILGDQITIVMILGTLLVLGGVMFADGGLTGRIAARLALCRTGARRVKADSIPGEEE